MLLYLIQFTGIQFFSSIVHTRLLYQKEKQNINDISWMAEVPELRRIARSIRRSTVLTLYTTANMEFNNPILPLLLSLARNFNIMCCCGNFPSLGDRYLEAQFFAAVSCRIGLTSIRLTNCVPLKYGSLGRIEGQRIWDVAKFGLNLTLPHRDCEL
ncbi:hypothetical protein VNO77_20162 [Canavalia gladiata]|uniref:Uncharacterized protein n=1 Tax=Canavalia gladiata TaxID=3824 RepID=A0AAN9LPN1_CANGL